MAKKKQEEESNGAEPDFELAAKIIKNDIFGSNDKRAKMNGDLSAAWKRVEESASCNKKAAKMVASIARMSEETQSDFLRTFVGLCGPMNVGIRRDLVDDAEGKGVFSVPVKEAPESELVDA